MDRQRQRFLTINVLAGRASGNGDDGMPMVRRGNDDRIHIFASQQIPEVLIFRACARFITLLGTVKLVHDFAVVFSPVGIYVAHCQHPGIWLAEKIVQQAATLCAGPDEA